MSVYLTPDSVKIARIGGETLTIKQKIVPDSARATKYVASYVQQGQPMKPCAPLSGTGKAKGVTVHNTGDITVAVDTTPAEQYARATWPNQNMGGVMVHFYVWHDDIWQLLDETERGWHATDGTSRRSSQRSGDLIGGNLDTIAIEAIGADAETEATAAKLTAYLLREHGLSPDTDVYNHNYFYSAKYCPVYILPRWSAFLAAVRSYHSAGAENVSTGDRELIPGDIVAFLGGNVYASSTAPAAAGKRGSSSCRVTHVAEKMKHPYHLVSVDGGGVYGWVDASSVSAEGTPPGEIAVGSTVRITGSKYATGQSIAPYAKNITHTVAQINGGRALLGFPDGIRSWVYLTDLKLA